MPHISQKKVSDKVLKRITDQFFLSISNQKSFNTKPFLTNLLTETEQVMLAKRLAVVLMLIDSTSYYKIKVILKVSTSTIKRLHQQLLAGEYDDIEKWFRNKKNKEAFWSEIERMVRVGMPKLGSGRWEFLKDL